MAALHVTRRVRIARRMVVVFPREPAWPVPVMRIVPTPHGPTRSTVNLVRGRGSVPSGVAATPLVRPDRFAMALVNALPMAAAGAAAATVNGAHPVRTTASVWRDWSAVRSPAPAPSLARKAAPNAPVTRTAVLYRAQLAAISLAFAQTEKAEHQKSKRGGASWCHLVFVGASDSA